MGDVYMAVSGCPHEIANHADVAAHFAIVAQSSILRRHGGAGHGCGQDAVRGHRAAGRQGPPAVHGAGGAAAGAEDPHRTEQRRDPGRQAADLVVDLYL